MKNAVVTGASSGMGREFVYAPDRDLEFDEPRVIARREERVQVLLVKHLPVSFVMKTWCRQQGK